MTHVENDGPDPGANDPLIEEAKRVGRDAGGSSEPQEQVTETLTDSPSRLPKRIGQYHIKRVIASGGMGTVYEAVQEKPRRPVALKLMKQGIASRSALRRFEYESQILARLRHPGIAQVYDAGTHKDDSGTTPYFAMEYIPNALPITKYVKEKKLGTRERMALFAQVCEAVHHGHQKGIIHRDLKPSNILVDAHGTVKIIDFGVARSTDSDLAVTTLQTDVAQLIGTLQYMSPEQCAADPHDIDTRSDIYALGMVFYELICERLPYDIRGAAIHEATRVIREQDPTPLSTINRTLRGDVETIALKALEKERDRRYQSATDFGQDIRRYLNSEAIVARRASILYQFRVLVRRNRGVFSAVAVVFMVLVAGVIVSTTLYHRAESARRDAERAYAVSEEHRFGAEKSRDEAEAVVDFLADMLASVNPRVDGKDVKVRQVLDGAAEAVHDSFIDQPLIEARLRHVMGWSYRSLGLFEKAEPHMSAAAAIRRRELGPSHPDTLKSMNNLGVLLDDKGEFAGADKTLRQTYEVYRRVLGDEHPDTIEAMGNLAIALHHQGQYAEAAKLYRETLKIRSHVLGDDHPETLRTKNNLANAVFKEGNYAEAEKLYSETLETRRRLLGEEDPGTLTSMTNLAIAYRGQGRYAEAEKLYRRTVEIQRHVLGEEHPDTLRSLNNLTNTLFDQGLYAEAERTHADILKIKRRVLGDEHPSTLVSMHNHADAVYSQGRYAEAADLHRAHYLIERRVLGNDHPDTLESAIYLAAALSADARWDEAERLYRTTIEIGRRKLGDEHPDVGTWLVALADTLVQKRAIVEAQQIVLEGLAIQRKALDESHSKIAKSKAVLGECLALHGEYAEAESQLLESYDRLRAIQGEFGHESIRTLSRIVRLYEAWHTAEPGQGHDARAAKWRAAMPVQDNNARTDSAESTE